MSIKLDSIILPNNIIDKMKGLLIETKSHKLEYGFDVCKRNNDLIIRHECHGTICSINLPQRCEIDEKLIGDYHTHPRGSIRMSDTDMFDACKLNFSCIGSSKQNKITCLVRRYDKSSMFCQEEVILEEANKTFIKNYNNIRDKYFRQIDIPLKKVYRVR